MRIIAGTHRGRILRAPSGQATRPTAERTREALFNMLAHAPWAPSLEGARVLDLFAGSGALGLEALSRGAAFALFVETEAAARGVLRDNIEGLSLFGHTRIHRRDATDLGRKPAGLGAPFDLVFADPPYRQGLLERSLPNLAAGGWITPQALIVAECAAEEEPALPPACTLMESRTYGAAKLLILQGGAHDAG